MDGPKGGEIVAAGTPEDIVKEKRSYTGQFFKPGLAKKAAGPKKEGPESGGVAYLSWATLPEASILTCVTLHLRGGLSQY